jgi:hypothetical protein
MFCFLHFVPSAHAPVETGWVDRYSFTKDNGDGTYTWTGNIGPQVFWDNKLDSWRELEFVKNDTYPYFITWASVANCTYFVRNSHVALEITNNSYVKLWNPDYSSVSVYSERWAVEYWQVNKWKDTGVGAQPNSWSVNQDADSVNITRIQKLVGVGELNVTYSVRKGAYLKHTIVFKSLDSGGGTYRVLMQWAGITNNKVKTNNEEFAVIGETHKVAPYFLVGDNSSSMVVQEYLESVYPNLTDIVFNTHAQGIKADVILGNWTLVQNGLLTIDPDTSTFDVFSDAYDGDITSSNSDYLTAHDAETGTASSTSIFQWGQSLPTTTYSIFRGVVLFNTSGLSNAVSIDSAKLCLGGLSDSATTDFIIRLQNWTEASDGISTADYNAFDGINYDDGLFDTTSWSLTEYNNITISNLNLININGNTTIFIRSSRDISSTPPTVGIPEFVRAAEVGGIRPAKLEVTYTTVTPEYDYVDSQTNVDSSADKGTHSSFASQQATDWTNDTLIEANTNTTVLNNAENFVDSNTSDQDVHTGHGTSSNFTAQQDANILYNDTLTEANTAGTTSDVFTSGFEVGKWDSQWDGNGATTWLQGTNTTPGTPWVTHSGTNMSYALNANDGNLISDDIDLSGSASAGVSFWYMVDDEEDADFRFYYYNGSTYNLQSTDLGLAATEDVWYKYSEVITDSQYLKANFRIDFNSAADANEGSFVDDVLVNKTLANNYELDYEFSWTTADFDEANEYLCIRTNSFTGTAENLGVDVWNGAGWTSISSALTTLQWNNISITTYLTSATIYFRFIGKTESSDTAQNTWIIECNLIHTWSVGVNYELDLEEQFTTANFSRTSVELCVRMGAYNTTENIRLDYWNASASAWIIAAATLTTNIWNNVSVKTYTSNASVTFTIRLVGVTESGDTERSAWDKDACLLHTWDAAGQPAFTLGQSLLTPTYNALSKAFGFQTTNTIIPTSTGYFWKSLPFQVTGAIKLYDSTNMAKAIGFLTSGILSFFSSLSKAVGLGFQPTVSIVPSSTNYFSKAIGFQATNTAQSFVSITMQKAIGFLTTGVANVWSSISKAVALNFQSSSTVLPSSTSYFSKALGFQTSEALISSSANYMWKALGFQATSMIQAFDSTSMLKGLDFLRTETSLTYSYGSMLKEVGFQVTEFQRSENILPSAMSYFWKAVGFQPTGTVNLYDSSSVGKGLGFLTTGIVNAFSNIQKGMTLAFQTSGSIRLWDSGVMLKALGYQTTASTRLFDSTTMLKGLGYLATNAINVFSSTTIVRAMGFQPTNTIISSSTSYFWKAIGLQPSDSIKAYDSNIMQKAIGFLSAGTTNVYSTILRGIELGFTPTSILYPFAYGTSGKETATILVDRFELAKLFDNIEMLKALGFRTTGSINLFDSSAMSKAIGLLTSGTINLYDASALLKAKGFLTVNNINLFSTVLRGVEVAFQSAGTVRFWESDSMLKALGFQSSDSIRLFDGNFFGKGLLFQSTQTINVFAGFQVLKEQLFTILNVFNYENVNPLASLSQTKAIQFSVLGELTKLFSSLSSNLGREFFNYDLIHPLAYSSQSKGLQFGLDGLIRVFSDTVLGKATGFLTTGTINVYSTILRGMELAFQPVGAVKLWDSNVMLKALGFQVNAATNLYDSATMLKALGFLTTGTTNTYSTIFRGISLAFTPTNSIYPFAYGTSGKETATILVDAFGLTKMFDSVSLSMEKAFFNYNLIQPSANSIQNKAVQFGFDGLARLFSDASIGIAKAFSNFAYLNPFSYLNENKAVGFNAYELPLFFDYSGMGKSIRITTFDFLNTELIRFSDTLTMGKSVFIAFAETLFDNLNIQSLMIPIGQIVLLGPGITPSNFWFMVFAFTFIAGITGGSYLYIRRRPEEEEE